MITYKDSGVDKEEGYRAVDLIKESVRKTQGPEVLNRLGGFGSLYELGKYENPVLVSGTDGVGTKLAVALDKKVYDTVGIDCFAMCANDILCHGARPLFFLDYIACGKLEADVSSQIVKGITTACLESGTALVGGETAEMPGFYKDGDYDVAGFCVGVAEKSKLTGPEKAVEGDVVIGIASSGVHSNGFSLIRKLVKNLDEDFHGEPVWKELIKPTRLYIKPVLSLLEKYDIHSMAHITGGGLRENAPRSVAEGLGIEIDRDKIVIPDIFRYLEKKGVPHEDMWNTFNMGIGFLLVVPENEVDDILSDLSAFSMDASVIGKVIKGERFCFA
ncbi:phosphoribosylformylglycinamidine cyclo-ligase [Spirochaeta isovalerica]|uniref:Phosphoribosylformylglycinamidine cyclo-ligase n=1 Tax=Spirochaeta isovalerica TaxID=150 RepID=A0A841R7A5_9SPIO|nr:phosphoribosylformylglycinamidine cyclo-ligase [Spirochaeta isovalerica]MBB6478638.1 phosphoribosylformylglycinamidine cyclo-ligase [Spirochaeta isovalerica]